MAKKQRITTVAQPMDYFRDLLHVALGHLKIKISPDLEYYLVNLLNQFMLSDRLFSRDEKGHMHQEPLALMIKDALETSKREHRHAMFRQVGDVSLYTAGFFQDSLQNKMVDVDYYIDMGGAAYKHAAASASAIMLRAVFQELSERFAKFVDVLAEVSDKTGARTEKDLLRIYELWLKTRSKRAEKALKAAGILPNKNVKKTPQ
ncbi:MAG: hypothetical protein A2583_05415 [Bdellovibrionales bacterium RIFOXYD1_FULL_53_11]|nr:MAG: hypothetical protein A2583_05415 [Bdellovibrionales bacterium RIFOXYD1_FULL_53_11]